MQFKTELINLLSLDKSKSNIGVYIKFCNDGNIPQSSIVYKNKYTIFEKSFLLYAKYIEKENAPLQINIPHSVFVEISQYFDSYNLKIEEKNEKQQTLELLHVFDSALQEIWRNIDSCWFRFTLKFTSI